MMSTLYENDTGEQQVNGPLVESGPNLRDKYVMSDLKFAVLFPGVNFYIIIIII